MFPSIKNEGIEYEKHNLAWEQWHLVIDGVGYYSKFKDDSDRKSHYHQENKKSAGINLSKVFSFK
jgi:hypothetical protein